MPKHLEIEGDIIGKREEDYSMGEGCYEEYGSGPCLWGALGYRDEIPKGQGNALPGTVGVGELVNVS